MSRSAKSMFVKRLLEKSPHQKPTKIVKCLVGEVKQGIYKSIDKTKSYPVSILVHIKCVVCILHTDCSVSTIKQTVS